MFGTEIHFITFFYLCIIAVNILPVFLNVIFAKNKGYHVRFFILLIAIFLNNLSSGIFPDENITINILSQNILAYTIGLTTTIYYFYYIVNQYKIKIIYFLNLQTLITILSLTFVLFFILPYTITNNLLISRSSFLLIPLCIITIIFYSTLLNELAKFKKSKNRILKFKVVAGVMGLLSIFSLPVIMILFGDNQPLEQTFYTIGFFFLLVSYYLRANNFYSQADQLKHSPLIKPEILLLKNSFQEQDNTDRENDEQRKLNLSDEIVEQILLNLSKFENEKAYLAPDLNLNNLSKKFHTNTNYLSKIINVHKGKKFIHYINYLRITYAVNKIMTDKKFRMYNIKAISEESGFNNAESFSKAFYLYTGSQPSNFIKEIDEKS